VVSNREIFDYDEKFDLMANQFFDCQQFFDFAVLGRFTDDPEREKDIYCPKKKKKN